VSVGVGVWRGVSVKCKGVEKDDHGVGATRFTLPVCQLRHVSFDLISGPQLLVSVWHVLLATFTHRYDTEEERKSLLPTLRVLSRQEYLKKREELKLVGSYGMCVCTCSRPSL
jgi:hypothetical protein